MSIKRFVTSFFLCLTCLLSLSSCGNMQNKDVSSSTTNNLDMNIAEDNINLHLCTDPFGGLYQTGFATATGYYDTLELGNSKNILYTDIATKQRIFLCNRPECQHNDDSCASWFEVLGSTNIFTDSSEQTLYFVSRGYADNSGANDNYLGRIYSMDANGSNRKVFYQLKSNEGISGAIAISDDSLYITVDFIKDVATNMQKEIRKIDLATGDATTIYQFDNLNNRVFGAFGQYLVLQSWSDSETNYSLLDVAKGTAELKYARKYAGSTPQREVVLQDNLVVARSTHDTFFEVVTINLHDKSEKVVANELELFSADLISFEPLFDNRVQINTVDNSDINNIINIRYNIDLLSAQCHQNSLSFKFFQDIRNVTILAEFQDAFLVEMAVIEQPISLTGNDGVPYQVDAVVPQYATIPKSDYWDGNPNYSLIADKISS